MIYLTDDEKNRKTSQEAAFWFQRAEAEFDRAEKFAGHVRGLQAHVAELEESIKRMEEHREQDAKRFEAINEFWHEARKTGYNTSWSIGGVTVEKLREETELARKYKAPSTILESELVRVGSMAADGDIYSKAKGLPAGVLFTEAVYAHRPTTAKVKGTKKP